MLENTYYIYIYIYMLYKASAYVNQPKLYFYLKKKKKLIDSFEHNFTILYSPNAFLSVSHHVTIGKQKLWPINFLGLLIRT